MKSALLLVPLLGMLGFAGAEREVLATGGGVVKPGQDLVLTYVVGGEWDRCYWFWNKRNEDPSSCSYDYNFEADDGKATLHRCTPKNASAVLEYSGTDKNVCQITIHNATDQDNCTFATRLGDERDSKEIDVIVASPIQGAVIEIGDQPNPGATLEANKSGNVVCTINGGRPAPSMTMSVDGIQILNDSQIQTPDEDGIYTTVQTYTVNPKIEDNGKTISCKAILFDGNNKPLYEFVEAKNVTLNVTFPPQPMAKQSVTAAGGKDANVSFVFQANPEPSDVKWIITIVKEETNATTEQPPAKREEDTLTISLGQVTEKYNASGLIDEGDLKYRVNLTIFSVTTQDARNRYTLVASNSLGEQKYSFVVELEGGGSSIIPGLSSGGAKAGLALTILAVIVVIAVVVIICIIYKKRRSRVDNTPLANMEAR